MALTDTQLNQLAQERDDLEARVNELTAELSLLDTELVLRNQIFELNEKRHTLLTKRNEVTGRIAKYTS